VQGYVRISSNGPRLLGSVSFGDAARTRFRSALPLTAMLRTSALFAQVASDDSYFTGLALVNPSGSAATVAVDVFDAAGILVASDWGSLAPGKRRSELLTQRFPALVGQSRRSGYIRVLSDQPLATFGLFGTNDLSALSAIPPQSVP